MNLPMKVYLVGGAVRDTILGLPVHDRDYVVVGSSPAEMVALGFTQVGIDFPVFLHPQTKEEYALARTERKNGVGYNGFATTFDPSITLLDDLARRDLTINSMAMNLDTSVIIDPYGGQQDLVTGTLRATSNAFKEDPVRILRTARFAARYNFTVDKVTSELMASIVHELEHVPQERIWAEMQKGLMEANPSQMFQVLNDCGALNSSGPLYGYSSVDVETLEKVTIDHGLAVRFTCAGFNMSEIEYIQCCIPNECSNLELTYTQLSRLLQTYHTLTKIKKVQLFDKLRAIHQPAMLNQCVQLVSLCNPSALLDLIPQIYADLAAVRKVDTFQIALLCHDPKQIRQAILDARIAAI